MPTTAPQPPKIAGNLRRLSRLIALVAVCAVLLVFVLPLAARQIIGPAKLKAVAEQALTDALGRRVTIEGEVSLLFAPWFGLAMGPVSVADAPGFGDSPMIAFRRLEMTIRVLPLFARVVSPGSVRVRDLHLHLRRDADGRGNWQDLARPSTAPAPEAPGWEIAPEPRDVEVENASVDYRDAATGRTMAVRDVRLKTGHGQPFSFSLSLRAEGFAPGGYLEAHARGKAAIDPAGRGLILEKTIVETGLVLESPLVPGGASPLRLVSRLAAAYDPATDSLALTELDARTAGARLTGSALVTDPDGAARIRTDLALALDMDGAWRELLGLAGAEGPDSLVAAPSAPAREPAPGAPQRESLSADNPPPPPGRAVLSLRAAAEAGRLDVERLELALPKGRLTGEGRFVAGAPSHLDAAFVAEDVDFDALPRPAGHVGWPWPVVLPTNGRCDARLELRRCKLAGLAVSDGQVTARGQDGLLRLAPAAFVLPGGVASLDARFDAGPAPAAPGAAEADLGLGLDIRAALQPLHAPGATPQGPTQARLLGRLRADGAKGNLSAQSPDPAQALELLGLGGLVPAMGPIEAKSAFSVTPGDGRAVARAALSGLEAKLAGAALRGRVGYDAAASPNLDFDLALDSLDLDRLGGLAGLAAPGGGQPAARAQAEGRLRIERLAGRGVEARNLALGLALGGGRWEAAVNGGELFGGRLSGKIEAEPAGRVTGSLQLAGAEARRLPGGPGLSGALAAKATIEGTLGTKHHPAGLTAAIEAEAPQLGYAAGGRNQSLTGVKAALAVKAKRAGTEGFDGEAGLTASLATGLGLREARLTASGPWSLDASGRPRESQPVKIEATGLARLTEAGKPVKVSLAGQVTPEADGGFSAADLRLDAGGLGAAVKLARKAGDGGQTTFSLDTGPFSPRKALADWGAALPAGLPADRLAKGSLSFSGAIAGGNWDIKRLALSVDDVNVTGSASLVGGDPKRGKWDLHVDRLDCDAYFPHQPTSGPPPPAERRKPLDLRLMRELALEARAHIGWLRKGNVTFDATTVTAGAKGGQFTYRQESPRFYGGRFSADIRGDARDTALKTLIELKLESIEIARFLRDWAEGDTLDSGSSTFILAGRTSGENEEELRANLAGNASLQVTRGALKVREPAKPGGQPTSENIPFDVFSSSWFSKGGVAHTDDFRIESPRMRVTGKGFVDLRDETINLSLAAALTSGGEVPATIIGPLDGPKLTIDRSKLLGDLVYRLLQGIVSIPGKAVTRILQIR
ncbi:MAG: AsmA family protein [Solidesulfovibrio sp.]|uniref:AsmA family protein n=1 Tax=Solidesulfovibrio sp. TaxID=2910990 RepID=UPI002B1FDAA3|nr:AsmA family protein [Solidesulfovibrio sp.]MEA4858596.1 AsmA family protein [Solidesulfovibrio sp.]